MVKLADIKATLERQGRRASDKLLLLKSGEKVRIRILLDFDDIEECPIWGRFGEDRVTIISPTVLGKTDPFLENPDDYDLNGIKKTVFYPLPVWNYDKERIQIWLLKGTQQGPISQILAYIADGDVTLTDHDIVISREGDGFDTKYNVVFKKESAFKPKKGGKKIKAKTMSWDRVTKRLFDIYPSPDLKDFKIGSADENIAVDDSDDDEDDF